MVTTSDGGAGLAYTFIEEKPCCSFLSRYRDAEGGPASVLLEALLSDHPIERSVGLATLNAMNHARALGFPTDDGAPLSQSLRLLRISPGTRTAMVGYVPPVARALADLGAELDVLDRGRNLGDHEKFLTRLAGWAEVLILSATTILNASVDELLAEAARGGARALMLGPSTPMVSEAFAGSPVVGLAGLVVTNPESAKRVVRLGGGTPEITPFARKLYCVAPAPLGDDNRAAQHFDDNDRREGVK
jgi:uncharacterized protein (DUF4213/DUF364 family)